jgi:uncharacterized protein (TIGR03435 family)
MKLLLFTAAMLVHAQTFDVATIKLNPQCNELGPSRGARAPGQIAMECADLRDLIVTAYGVFPNGSASLAGSYRTQVIGGPKWIDSDRYEILAKASGNPPTAQLLGPMLRALLEDRFHLKVHRETKEGRIYKLTVAKNGPKLQPSSEREAVTMAEFCARLSTVLDGEVIDTTGITGRFDIQHQVDPSLLTPRFVAGRDQSPGTAFDDNPDRPSIFTVLQQQFGLKLEAARGPVQTIVVDAIERPTEN